MAIDSREAAHLVLDTVLLVMRVVAADLRGAPQGLMPVHFGLLGRLAQRPRSLGDLAVVQSVSPPTMSKTITTLEERGWVCRVRSAEDRRVVMVELTPAGRDVLADVRRHSEKHVADLLDALSEADRETLANGLTVLGDAFSRVMVPSERDSS